VRLIATQFLDEISARGRAKPFRRRRSMAVALPCRNVRELRNIVHRAYVMAQQKSSPTSPAQHRRAPAASGNGSTAHRLTVEVALAGEDRAQ